MSGSTTLPIKITVDGVQQADAALQQIAASGARAGQQLNAAASTGSQGMGRLTQALQSGGYQMQDFLVQVQGGTSAMTALAQQGSQFLGIFGTGGAIAGAALAAGVMAAKLLGLGDAMERLNAIAKEQEAAQKSLADYTETLTQSFDDQRRSITELAAHYQVLDAAEREYEGRRLARARNKLLEEQTSLSTRAANMGAAAAATAGTSVGFGAPDMMPLGGIELDDSVGQLRQLTAQLRNPDSTPGQLAQVANQLDTLAKSGAQAATEARRLRDAMDELIPQARLLDQQLGANQRSTDALNGGGLWLTLPPVEPTDGAPAASRSRSGRGRANPADRADVSGTLEKILQDQDKAARSLGASLSPTIAAWEKYQETIDKVRQASDLYYRTIDRVGGPLGISPEQAAEFESLAQDQYEASMKRIEEQGDRTGKTLESAFGKATSALEDVLVKGGDVGDILKGLEQDFVRLIYRATIMKNLETAGNAASDWAAKLAGDVAGSLFGMGAGGTTGDKGLTASTTKTTGVSGGSKFAMGGIMTSDGPLPLRRYAAGGIANSPQLALFGEGDGPEAYVPLPDGRSIPVTMQGQGGGTAYAPNFNIDARGADAGVEARLMAMMQRLVAADRAQFVADVQRGGAMSRSMGRRR